MLAVARPSPSASNAEWVVRYTRVALEAALTAQVPHDLLRRLRPVERVEVQARRAAREQSAAHVRGPLDPDSGHRDIVVAHALQEVAQAGRDRRAAHRGEALDLADVGHRHDPRHDRRGDAGGARTSDEVEVIPRLEEELGDEHPGAGPHLLPEMP